MVPIKYLITYNSPEHDVQTNDPMVTFTYVGPLWWQSKQYLLAGIDSCSRSTVKLYSSCFFVPLAISDGIVEKYDLCRRLSVFANVLVCTYYVV